MTGGVAEAVSLVLMAVCLGTVLRRPQGTLAGLVAVAAAAFLIAAGAVSVEDARHTIGDLTSTIVFLAAILVLGHLADEAGVFTYLAAVAARGSGGTHGGCWRSSSCWPVRSLRRSPSTQRSCC